ncbi:NIPA-like protein 2 [Penicillium rolfsii]|nr:NIPA-like protein 2 [Penicillium rolfsii]
MDSPQNPLVAGLLTSFVSSTIAPSVATPYPTSYSTHIYSAFSNSTTQAPSSRDGDDRGNMERWSSLIGIVTALIGNVLISVALNIQRYAHIRIAREWEQKKVKKESERRRTRSGVSSANQYGTVRGDGRGRSREQDRPNGHEQFEAYRDDADAPPRGRHDIHSSRDSERDSFASGSTVRPEDSEDRKSYLRSPYWWAGIILMVLGETGNFLAYGFAPASIVSPLGVVALISNCVIAPCLLKEKFRQRDFWGVLVAIAGAVVVVLSARSSEEKIGPDEIWMMITRWEFELYLGLTSALIVGLMWASFSYGSRSILIDVGLVALFGGYTALSTKGVSSLLSFTLWHVITFPITYLLVFVLVTSALMQIRYINRALQRFDSTQVIPTQFVLFTLSVIVGSAVLYRDFESMSAGRAGKFVGGCALTFLGVYFITSGRVRSDDESSFSTDDEEEAIGLLHGERYRDSIDLSPPAQQFRVPKAVPVDREDEDATLSPAGSLTSRGIDGIDDDQLTPRGAHSGAPSSPAGSLTAESPLSGPSFDHASPLRPPSRMSNPWADSIDAPLETPNSDLETYTHTTPAAPEVDESQQSTVLLRFPPAPGMEEDPAKKSSVARRASTPTGLDHAHNPERSHAALETPSRRAMRNSISNRFSPGPLLPTLSGGFSAVVAESLRRGEGSPLKDRSRRKLGRRRQLDGAFENDQAHYQDGDLGMDGLDHPLNIATARLQSATGLAVPSGEDAQSTPALATEISTPPIQKTDEEVGRLRSFSDSWSGGLAWLGGALRLHHQDPPVDSGVVTQGTASPQDNQDPTDADDHTHIEAGNTERDSRS